jgi:hypothetical protein
LLFFILFSFSSSDSVSSNGLSSSSLILSSFLSVLLLMPFIGFISEYIFQLKDFCFVLFHFYFKTWSHCSNYPVLTLANIVCAILCCHRLGECQLLGFQDWQ